ncbi:unnamed protein product [Heligmosomoides polygyrus]|uniref:Dynein light chain n=1 Tax=Heligmosomoides polygyrus TaxID=6339 RepID=A0A183GLK5_HELPZ|nr:unnamed protein product [Heligmosomoides polygyrus]
MAPAPEQASKNFMEAVDKLWRENREAYLSSPVQFFADINQKFADKKLFMSLHTSEVLPGYLVSARCMVQNTLAQGRLYAKKDNSVYLLSGFNIAAEICQLLLHVLYIGPSLIAGTYSFTGSMLISAAGSSRYTGECSWVPRGVDVAFDQTAPVV